MNRFKRSFLVGLVAIVGTACKPDVKTDPRGGGSAAGPADKPVDKPADTPARDPANPFADWDMAARKAAFQGAHVTYGGPGWWEAWNVEGDKVTVWDGTEETVLQLELTSPCEAALTRRLANGTTSGTIHHYTLENGALIMGVGLTGAVKGKTAIACMANRVVTLDADGTCLIWDRRLYGGYDSEPGTCSLDKDVFKATANGSEGVLEVHGDALYSEQIRLSHNEKAADYAAAKAMRDARK